MPTLETEFEVYCSCGEGLCRQTTEGKNRHSPYITVEPCKKCLDVSFEEGYEKGVNDGKTD